MPVWSQVERFGGDAVVLENSALRVTILPQFGGRIWSILDLAEGRERLWRNPGLAPAPASRGAGYDDRFAGGWDDLFPSDAPCRPDGLALPDHGEWWTQPVEWSIAETPDALAVELRGAGWATPHQWTRTCILARDLPVLQVSTTIHHTGADPFRYLWRAHPAMPAIPGGRIHLPAASVLVEGDYSTGLATGRHDWPRTRTRSGEECDLSLIPDRSASGMLAIYADRLAAGWCAVTGPDGAGLGFAFDPSVIDAITLFADYGGWRGLHAIIPEPGVGFPAEVGGAIAGEGRHPVLRPGEAVRFDIAAVSLPPGTNAIAAIDPSGAVTRQGA